MRPAPKFQHQQFSCEQLSSFFLPPSTCWGLSFFRAGAVAACADDEEGEAVVAKGDLAGGVADFVGVSVAGFGDEGAEVGFSKVGGACPLRAVISVSAPMLLAPTSSSLSGAESYAPPW